MKNLILFLFLILPLHTENMTAPIAKDQSADVLALSLANGFSPSQRIVKAIVQASKTYDINALDMTAIAIVETGIGTNNKTRLNANGTTDKGLFQINSINWEYCFKYDLNTVEGSSLCAAKLLAMHKKTRLDYIGVYHSKDKTKKSIYLKKIAKVLKNYDDKSSNKNK